MEDARRLGPVGTPPPGGCEECYAYGVVFALVGASLQAVDLQVTCDGWRCDVLALLLLSPRDRLLCRAFLAYNTV